MATLIGGSILGNRPKHVLPGEVFSDSGENNQNGQEFQIQDADYNLLSRLLAWLKDEFQLGPSNNNTNLK